MDIRADLIKELVHLGEVGANNRRLMVQLHRELAEFASEDRALELLTVQPFDGAGFHVAAGSATFYFGLLNGGCDYICIKGSAVTNSENLSFRSFGDLAQYAVKQIAAAIHTATP